MSLFGLTQFHFSFQKVYQKNVIEITNLDSHHFLSKKKCVVATLTVLTFDPQATLL